MDTALDFAKWGYEIGGPWAIVLVMLCIVIRALYRENKELKESERKNSERVVVLGQAMLASNQRSIEKNTEQTNAIKSLTDAMNRIAPR